MTHGTHGRCNDERDAQGSLVNGFDYDLQVWVRDGIVLNCGHCAGYCGCNARIYSGQTIKAAREREAQSTRGLRVGSAPSHGGRVPRGDSNEHHIDCTCSLCTRDEPRDDRDHEANHARNADHVDGYDRDDLGESNDF